MYGYQSGEGYGWHKLCNIMRNIVVACVLLYWLSTSENYVAGNVFMPTIFS